jgi:hypothetical protein
MSTAQERQAFVAAVGRSEIEDAIANEFHRAAAPKAEDHRTMPSVSACPIWPCYVNRHHRFEWLCVNWLSP